MAKMSTSEEEEEEEEEDILNYSFLRLHMSTYPWIIASTYTLPPRRTSVVALTLHCLHVPLLASGPCIQSQVRHASRFNETIGRRTR